MIISVNWLKKFTAIDARIDELAEVIGARLVEIEGIESLGPKYKDVVIARVMTSAHVEGSDHLNLTTIDDGGVVSGVERNADGYVQVVCGAPNVREELLVAWLPPGSTVPDSYNDAEPFVLGARKLRGFVSNGMLASARELDLFDDHDGILEIDKDVAPGTSFMDAYALDDYLLDIENKSLTHRPDTFGVVGFAREVAAIAGKGFAAPAWLDDLTPGFAEPADAVDLSVAVNDPALSSRYQAVALGGLDRSARTPLDIATYLARSGVRPISPIVDITNYLMLLTGQPLHAFDYDKVAALGSTHLHVRGGYDGETLALLDGRTIELSGDDIVIAAGDRAVALAGAMGGADTEIDAGTTRIIIESASFDLYHLRRTQMRHGVFSEAVTRFTKGQPAALTAPVLAEAVRLLGTLCGGTPISALAEDYPMPATESTLRVSIGRINSVLGTKFSIDDAAETLGNVGFAVSANGEELTATAPYWRTDIHIAEDLIEEIGRMTGFDDIELNLPARDFTAVSPDAAETTDELVRACLSAAGANEVLTYSFVHGDLLARAGQSPDAAYALANAISPGLQYYRLSLTPSLLDKVSPNLRQSSGEFALYEFGVTHVAGVLDDSGLPAEFARLGFTYAANAKYAAGRGAAYYTAKRYLDAVLDRVHVTDVTYRPLSENTPIDVAAAPFEPRRSAAVYAGDTYLGVVGEYCRTVRAGFKLPEFTAGFEILRDPLHSVTHAVGTYVPLSRYQASDADVTFAVPTDTPYGAVEEALASAASRENVRVTYAPLDIFAPEDNESRNLTFRVTAVSYDATLTRADMNAIITRVSDTVTSATGSRVV